MMRLTDGLGRRIAGLHSPRGISNIIFDLVLHQWDLGLF